MEEECWKRAKKECGGWGQGCELRSLGGTLTPKSILRGVDSSKMLLSKVKQERHKKEGEANCAMTTRPPDCGPTPKNSAGQHWRSQSAIPGRARSESKSDSFKWSWGALSWDSAHHPKVGASKGR